MTSMAMEKDGQFADFDNDLSFNESQKRALDALTRNFVVQFGEEGAEIAFDFKADGIKALLDSSAPEERPVRWM